MDGAAEMEGDADGDTERVGAALIEGTFVGIPDGCFVGCFVGRFVGGLTGGLVRGFLGAFVGILDGGTAVEVSTGEPPGVLTFVVEGLIP
jgi:hypothetical protein